MARLKRSTNRRTIKSQQLHTVFGRNETIYKTFTFYGIRIWNYLSTKMSVDVSYASSIMLLTTECIVLQAAPEFDMGCHPSGCHYRKHPYNRGRE